jgi:spore maturation protein CgeB
VIERPFKVLAAGGFCVSDYVPEARDLFTEEELPMAESPSQMAGMIRHFVECPEFRRRFIDAGRRKVLMEHTYFDRVCQFFDHLGMAKESANALRVKGELLKGLV